MKFLVVAAIIALIVFGRGWYLRYRAAIVAAQPEHPRLPAALVSAAERTWVVFTTPFCASCEPVKQRLAAHDPAGEIVTVDATREPHLADAFHVKSAPTVLLADAAGVITERLVGAGAVHAYLARVGAG